MASVRSASPFAEFEEGPSCPKKQKLEFQDSQELQLLAFPANANPHGPTHDDTYYFQDGSCVLQVENTLFNVHRSILSRDSSSFSTMFALPQGTLDAEGSSDLNPVVLQGDSPTDFRDFLWSLYALPPELLTMHTPRADVVKLVNIAKVSHKYSFRSVESWACDAILEYVARQPSPFNNNQNHEQLILIIRLAHVCQQDKLLESSILLLRQRIGRSDELLPMAMNLADELDIDSLRGTAYFEALHRGESFWTSGAITDHQRLCLLQGYYRLSKEWEKLRNVPPRFDHAKSCGVTWVSNQCTNSWIDFWKKNILSDAVMGLPLEDVVGRLRILVKELDRWGQASYMHHECRVEAKKRVIKEIKTLEESMPTIFTFNLPF